MKITKEFLENTKRENQYHIILCKSRVGFPMIFFTHPWFIVIDKKGSINRFEVINWRNKHKKNNDNWFFKNAFEAYEGLYLIPQINFHKMKGKIIFHVRGGENSLAHKVFKFFQKEVYSYPFKNKYSYYPGPNSNTFVQWVLNKFPELNYKLRFDSLGRNYKE